MVDYSDISCVYNKVVNMMSTKMYKMYKERVEENPMLLLEYLKDVRCITMHELSQYFIYPFASLSLQGHMPLMEDECCWRDTYAHLRSDKPCFAPERNEVYNKEHYDTNPFTCSQSHMGCVDGAFEVDIMFEALGKHSDTIDIYITVDHDYTGHKMYKDNPLYVNNGKAVFVFRVNTVDNDEHLLAVLKHIEGQIIRDKVRKELDRFSDTLVEEVGERLFDKMLASIGEKKPKKANGNYEMVDLGLPSGLKWATCNIGASKPEEYGDYFMWGSTTPNNEDMCDWAHAPFNNGASDFDETYFNAHKSEWLNNDVLKSEYDAATQKWGTSYRMPTKEDFDELLANTNKEWTTINGVNGRKFTSKTDTTKSIFIPASGVRKGSSFISQGSEGYVWSSSLNSDFTDLGFYLYFDSYCCVMSTLSRRYHGFCVRPVSNK